MRNRVQGLHDGAVIPERVDFYLLGRADDDSRRKVACRIAAKAWRQGFRVYIQVETPAEAESLDGMLWECPPASFVPHARAGTAEASGSPVQIGYCPAPEGWRDLLVSLTHDVPEGVAECRRVADLILDRDTHLAAGRTRFRAYLDMGVSPMTHKIQL